MGTPAASCVFDNSNFALDGKNICSFVATPKPTSLTISSVIDSENDPNIDDSFTTTLTCTNVSPEADETFGTESVSTDMILLIVDWYSAPVGASDCTAVMVPNSAALEDGECSFSFVLGDVEAGCEVTNTVFFEGIPTLDRYGLAFLTLLIMGVGMLGVRRLN